MDLDKAIKTRISVRDFLNKKPDWRKILRAIDAARFAPMAGNLFNLKFIVVKDEKQINKLKEACQQDFVAAPYIVVVVSNPEKATRNYDERGEKYTKQQAGAAIENFLLALNQEGLSTCWTGHFVDEQVKKILELPDKMDVEGIFPIGIASKDRTKRQVKTKIELDDILYFDKWDNKYLEPKTKTSIEGS
ncbi:MAG: nitroreductase family protein [Candidatus Nanoarchaeia archaeon]